MAQDSSLDSFTPGPGRRGRRELLRGSAAELDCAACAACGRARVDLDARRGRRRRGARDLLARDGPRVLHTCAELLTRAARLPPPALPGARPVRAGACVGAAVRRCACGARSRSVGCPRSSEPQPHH